MIEKKSDEKTIIKIFLFFIIFYLLIIHIKSFQYFKSFTLFSNDIALITEEGIIKYDQITKNKTLIIPVNLITSNDAKKCISFSQLPSDDGGYIFIRLKNFIYLFDQSLNYYNKIFEVSEITDSYCALNAYKTLDGKILLIISYITGQQKLKLLMYEININSEFELESLVNQTECLALNQDRQLKNILNNAISCELMHSSNYSNKILTCFVVESKFLFN